MQNLLELAYHIKTATSYTSVPAPVDGDLSIPWFWDWVASQIPEWAHDGITDLLAPPPGLSQSGTYQTGDGYGAFNPFYQLDGTRFGPKAAFQRMVAIAHRYGMRVHADLVLHQRDGGVNGFYDFPGSDQKVKNGRWPLTPIDLVGPPPRGPRDYIPSPNDDFGFGDECRYWPQNMADSAIAAIDWLFLTADLDGARVDDTKALNVPFVYRMETSRSMAKRYFVGEFYDGKPDNLNWIVWDSGMNGRSSTFDFTYRWKAQRMANSGGNWDMRQWTWNPTFSERCPLQSVTFGDNHDTDLSFPIIWNKIMTYAIGSGWPGLMGIFGRDYYQYTNCYGLRPAIANLIWCRNMFANGRFVFRHADYYTLAYERTGDGLPGALWVINNQMGSLKQPSDWREITLQTSHPQGTRLHDYSVQGSNDAYVGAGGWVTLWVPPNDNGRGYGIWALDGHQGAVPYVPSGWATTNMFEGADDLPMSTGPAVGGSTITTGIIWTDADMAVNLKLIKSPSHLLTLSLVDDAGRILRPDADGNVKTKTRGAHSVAVTSSELAGVVSPFTVEVTYHGLSKLEKEDWAPAVVNKALASEYETALQSRAAELRAHRAKRVAMSLEDPETPTFYLVNVEAAVQPQLA